MSAAASKGVATPLQTAVTTGTGTGVAVPITSKNPRVHMRAAGTITAGTVVLEEASVPSYTGAWSLLYTYTPTSDGETVVHIAGTVGALRTRVTSNILGGGTVTTELVSD